MQRELLDDPERASHVVGDVSVDERGVGLEAKATVAKEVLPSQFLAVDDRGLVVDRLGQVEREQRIVGSRRMS